MESNDYRQPFARRWPFLGLAVAVAGVWLLLLTLQIPAVLRITCGYAVALCWYPVSRARMLKVGLPRWSFRVIEPLILLVLLAFLFLVRSSPAWPLFLSGLFVLLHIPLVVLKEKTANTLRTVG